MKTALIENSNRNAEGKLRLMLIDEFKVGERYTNKDIKDRLQRLYLKLNIKNADGTIKKATGAHLTKLGFQLNECKVKQDSGRSKPGQVIVRISYSAKIAA